MERPAHERGALRFGSSVALGLAVVCFLLPVATVGCEDAQTYRGVDLLEGDARDFTDEDEDGGQEPEEVLGSAAASATLAVVFAGVGALAALGGGLLLPAVSLAAGWTAVGALLALLATAYLRGFTSAFVDMRYGYWAALGLATAGAAAAAARWRRRAVVVPGRPLLAGWLGVCLLVLGALVQQARFPDAESDPDVVTGFPLTTTLAPGTRREEAWDAALLVGIPFVAAIVLLCLARGASRRAAWTMVGLGTGVLLIGLQHSAYFAAADQYSVGDGAFLWILGGAALVGAALDARPVRAGDRPPLATPLRATAMVGALAALAATAIPFQRNGGGDQVALLYGGLGATRWLVVAPVVLAAAAAATALLAGRADAPAVLLGLAVPLLLTYVVLLSPLFAETSSGEPSREMMAGAFVGVGGALVLAAAGGVGLLRRRPRTGQA